MSFLCPCREVDSSLYYLHYHPRALMFAESVCMVVGILARNDLVNVPSSQAMPPTTTVTNPAKVRTHQPGQLRTSG